MKCPMCGGKMRRSYLTAKEGPTHVLWYMYCHERPDAVNGCGYWFPCDWLGDAPGLDGRIPEDTDVNRVD
jgi:hypothetical protein